MKNRLFVLPLLLISLTSLLAAEPRYPREIENAEKTILAWVGGLQGKSQQEVEKKLGTPTARSTWTSDGEQRVLFMYRFPTGGELKLYFSKDGKVVVANHTLMVQ
jgi:outer membrane protein assembly factor BamE (lipoprotein component of BamABCDE complex)